MIMDFMVDRKFDLVFVTIYWCACRSQSYKMKEAYSLIEKAIMMLLWIYFQLLPQLCYYYCCHSLFLRYFYRNEVIY